MFGIYNTFTIDIFRVCLKKLDLQNGKIQYYYCKHYTFTRISVELKLYFTEILHAFGKYMTLKKIIRQTDEFNCIFWLARSYICINFLFANYSNFCSKYTRYEILKIFFMASKILLSWTSLKFCTRRISVGWMNL